MQCTTDSECQENAGCFIIEPLELDPITGAPKTTCHCGLGYLLDNSTASYPKTGTCENLRTRPCTGNTATDYCITNTEGWGVCPYCRVRFLVLFGLVVSNISIFRRSNTKGITVVSLVSGPTPVVRGSLIAIR